MSQKDIYLVTCGETRPGPNPGMTKEGLAAVQALRRLLPAEPSAVICGTGHRHREVAAALGLDPNRYSILAGTADKLEGDHVEGKIIIADGTRIPAHAESSSHDIASAVHNLIRALPHNTIVCTDESFLRALGNAGYWIDIAPATAYKITVDHGGHVNITKR
ncbi:MAG: hypothetical protein HY980_01515 [Candidatus Magasanikbacteria bacterium]|nr:hypothetical protein [Candidatus Magasanikbacteria bacterium]